MPLASGGISAGDVLQMTSDGKDGYRVLEGHAGAGLALPSWVSAKDLSGATSLNYYQPRPWIYPGVVP